MPVPFSLFLWQNPAFLEHKVFKNPAKILIKLDGIAQKVIAYRSPGFRMTFTRKGNNWHYLIKKNGKNYELYIKTGLLLDRGPSIHAVMQRLDAQVLMDGFKRLYNKKQNFNIIVDAGDIGRRNFK